jgi:DNA-directed RNA polymerase specialized sigma24 family protein
MDKAERLGMRRLAADALDGGRNVWELILSKKALMAAVARRRLREHPGTAAHYGDVNDALHDALIYAFRTFHFWRPAECSLEVHLVRATHRAVNYGMRLWRPKDSPRTYYGAIMDRPCYDPPPGAGEPEPLLALVRKALGWLAPSEEAVLRCMYLEGEVRDRAEVAALLGKSAATVANLKSLALRKLRVVLAPLLLADDY